VFVLEQFSTADNNFGAVVGVVPEDFQENSRLPLGWRVPGYGIICGTGELLGGYDAETKAYAEPLAKGDEIAVRFTEADGGSIEFVRNGKSLGVAFRNVGNKNFRLATSLIKTQTITLAAAGHAERKAARAARNKAAEQKKRKQHFNLGWQIRAVRHTGSAVLYWSEETKRFLAEEPEEDKREKQENIETTEEKTQSNDMKVDELLREIDRAIDPDVKQNEGNGNVVKGMAGVVANADLVAMAKARAARAREEAEQAKLVERMMDKTRADADAEGAVKDAGGVAAAAKAAASEKPLLILDLPNICMRHGKHKKFSCAGVQICIEHFRKKGFKKLIAFVPEHLLDYESVGRHRNLLRLGMETTSEAKTKLPDNVSLLLSLKEEGYVVPTPPQDYDDSYCIEYAHKHGGYVVTNDKYRDCTVMGVTRDWLRTHLYTYTFVANEFIPNPDFSFR